MGTQRTMRAPRLEAAAPRAARPRVRLDPAGNGKAGSAGARAHRAGKSAPGGFLPEEIRGAISRRSAELVGLTLLCLCALMLLALATWSADDPSFSRSSAAAPSNLLSLPGAVFADLMMQLFGVAALAVVLPIGIWGWLVLTHRHPGRLRARLFALAAGVVFAAGFAACLPRFGGWPLPSGLGGVLGEGVLAVPAALRAGWLTSADYAVAGLACLIGAALTLPLAVGFGLRSGETGGADERHRDAPPAGYEDDEPGWPAFLLGMTTHAVLSLRARFGSGAPHRPRPARPSRGLADRLRGAVGLDGDDEDEFAAATRGRHEPSFGRRDFDEEEDVAGFESADDGLPDILEDAPAAPPAS
ncbi:DNA translocase FtsK 4TM domain-containing protein, partial [Ancylobacter dichloromethanicus]